jgi:hypothetical protein
MAGDTKVELRLAILKSVTIEAGGFYKLIVTVSSAFLGGSLLFLERIAPAPTPLMKLLLALTWFALIGAIACVAWVRCQNLRAARLALDRLALSEGDDEAKKLEDEAKKLDRHKELLSSYSQYCLVAGMLLLSVVGMLNLNQCGTERKDHMPDAHQRAATASSERSIPYSSLVTGRSQHDQTPQSPGSQQQQSRANPPTKE